MTDSQPGEAVTPAVAGSDTGLLVIGAAVVLVGWLVFSVFMGEYTYGATYLAVAGLVVLATRNIAGVSLGTGTLKLLGYFMGLVGVVLLIGNLRFEFPSGVADNIANIVFYVGCLLMALGARGMGD